MPGALMIKCILERDLHIRDIESESRAAVAGGITSYIEQPNTVPML
jgi:dihydroorotase-like cyclic amidohydrolase